ncbi:MAG TPA: DUF6174 domain-containing protein [Longimicrobiaceae bacterium]|jgi:hypothetical protein
MSQPRPRSTRFLLALAPLALGLQGCDLDPSGPAFHADELRAARAAWAGQGIDSYRYVIARSCGECTPESIAPALVEVRGGKTVSVVAATSVQQIQPELYRQFDTVEELFDVIEDAIDQDPYRFSARYDSRTGVPVSYAADMDRSMVDDERGFTVSQFEEIQ